MKKHKYYSQEGTEITEEQFDRICTEKRINNSNIIRSKEKNPRNLQHISIAARYKSNSKIMEIEFQNDASFEEWAQKQYLFGAKYINAVHA